MTLATAVRPTRERKSKQSPAPSPLIPANSILRVADKFRILGDPTRLRMLTILAAGERNVGELCRELGVAQPAASHHLALSKVSNLIESRRQGKFVYYRLSDAGQVAMKTAAALA